MRCVWLDGAATKACTVLRARLSALGYEVICKSDYADEILDVLAKTRGCIVVSTDKRAPSFGWIYIDFDWVKRKSARDIASRIIKELFKHVRGEGI